VKKQPDVNDYSYAHLIFNAKVVVWPMFTELFKNNTEKLHWQK